MSEVEQLAQEQFNTFKTRLCEILSEIEEEHKSAFIQGYAKGETDAKFSTEQENAALKAQIEKMKCCENCRWDTPYNFCEECTRFKGPISPEAVDNWELKEK